MMGGSKNIVLCGFMGSGKSTLGQLLAGRLRTAFADTDDCIVSTTGCDIPTLFKQRGEAGFREVEHQVLVRLLTASQNGAVIATGGGICTYPGNIEIMRNNGIVVFLNPGFAVCFARVGNSDRPMVRSRSKEGLRELYQQRLAGYRDAAHIEIAASGPAERWVNDIVAMIKESVRR